MKQLLFFFLFCSGISSINAQQGMAINSDASQPHASALLDIKSTTKGFLLPRMTAAQRTAITTPATGLQVYQTDGAKGFYYYDGSAWILSGAAGANLTGWSTSGNAAINPTTNFIGTTDVQPFIGKVNGQQVFRFSSVSTSTLIGYQANNATASGGAENHIIGYQAGFNNSGFDNHFDGYKAGYKNTKGYNNQFIGFQAGYSTTTGTDNLFIGTNSGYNNITLSGSHFIGNGAGFSNTTGVNNHFTGFDAGLYNTSGSNNNFSGNKAGFSNISGSNNHFDGFQAGYNNTFGGVNLFVGNLAGYSNITGSYNSAFGYKAGYSNQTGNYNISCGLGSGYKNESGSYNTYLGNSAGHENISGSGNVAIGYNAGFYSTGDNKLYIGNSANSELIYGEFDHRYLQVNGSLQVTGGQTVYSPAQSTPALVVSSSQLGSSVVRFRSIFDAGNFWDLQAEPFGNGEFMFKHNGLSPIARIKPNGDMTINGMLTELSDKSLKTNVLPIENTLQKLQKISGYTYNWIDKSKSEQQQVGLLAQEVEAQFPQLIITDKDGLKSVSYTHMVPVLIESIKEQQKMIVDLRARNEDQQKENARLKKDIDAIKTKLGI